MRKKARFLGLWINRASETFEEAPLSYSLASTRAMQDITDAKTFASLSLGTLGLNLRPKFGDKRATLEPFSQALRAVKTSRACTMSALAAWNSFQEPVPRNTGASGGCADRPPQGTGVSVPKRQFP